MAGDISGETNDGGRKLFESSAGLCGFNKGDIARAWQAAASSGPDVSHLLPQLDFHGSQGSAASLPKVAASSFAKPGGLETPKVDGVVASPRSNPFAAPKADGVGIPKADAMAMPKGAGAGFPKFDAMAAGKLDNFAPPKLDAMGAMPGDMSGAADPTGITAMVGHFMKLLEGMASFPSAESLLDPHIAGEVTNLADKMKA
jgi:hypothetical protein